MIVAGLGFRRGASMSSLEDALLKACVKPVDSLATIDEKATSESLVELSDKLNIPIIPISKDLLGLQKTVTHSDRVKRLFGTGSIAEASALAAAGSNGRLIETRKISDDGMATAAIATGDGK